jgi:hypothetical protein
MKKILFVIVMIIVSGMSAVVLAQQAGQQGKGEKIAVYNPLYIYKGDYQPDVLLFKNPWSTDWQRLPKLDYLQKVTCQDALAALNKVGKWKGNLRMDGSCGSPAEPSDWAMGNRLNYENELDEGK